MQEINYGLNLLRRSPGASLPPECKVYLENSTHKHGLSHCVKGILYGERNDHTRWGTGGQTSTQVIVLSKPIQSWTYAPIGQSDRPESIHYRDQAEKLFSIRKLKPTWWLAEDLARHIESRTVLAKAP